MTMGGLQLLDIFLLGLIVGVVDDELDFFGFLQRIDERLQQSWVAIDRLGPCLDQRMLQTFLSKRVIGRSYGYRLRNSSMGCSQPMRTVQPSVS